MTISQIRYKEDQINYLKYRVRHGCLMASLGTLCCVLGHFTFTIPLPFRCLMGTSEFNAGG